MNAEAIGFFVHLQKTGGTALYQRLRESLGARAVYPGEEDRGDVRAVMDVDHLRAAFEARRSELRVVTGHFPLVTTDVLGGGFRTFTVLRDPVQRTLSLLRRRQAADERYLGRDLQSIYDDPSLVPIIRNHMVKMLSLEAHEMGQVPLTTAVTFDAPRLDRAKQNLAGIDVVGLQEGFEEFCDELGASFGWDLGPPRFANRTRPTEVDASLCDRIAEDNEMDLDLYAWAVSLIEQRHIDG